jgi:hypothetical protein
MLGDIQKIILRLAESIALGPLTRAGLSSRVQQPEISSPSELLLCTLRGEKARINSQRISLHSLSPILAYGIIHLGQDLLYSYRHRNDYSMLPNEHFLHRFHQGKEIIEDSFDSIEDISETQSFTFSAKEDNTRGDSKILSDISEEDHNGGNTRDRTAE